jgi:predicted dienelactone hydrolase
VDSARADRELPIFIWYPAIAPEDGSSPGLLGWKDAEGDVSNAPYPLILYSHWLSGSVTGDVTLLAHLASQGFVVASLDHRCDGQPTCNLDRPLDMLFALEQLGSVNEVPLAGLIEADNVGVMGISSGGYTALAAAGGQLDPAYFVDFAESQTTATFVGRNVLNILQRWEEVEAYANQVGIVETNDHWSFGGDDRIKAVLPMSPAVGFLFGEHGLEPISAPTLMFAPTEDEYFQYEQYYVPLFSQLGAPGQHLITFTGFSHHPEWTSTGEAYYKHFSTAFFGFYLQGRQGYADYLTEAFVSSFDDLAWGVYQGE